MTILLFIIILAVLVVVHECGHFLAAKRSGVRVDEFGLGFPPRLWVKRWGETEYSLNLIPFGGFVKIFGEQSNEETLVAPHSLISKSRWVQAWVLAAGVIFNLLFAWFLLALGLSFGLPVSRQAVPEGLTLHNPELLITEAVPGKPAALAGLKGGEVLLAIGDDRGTTTNPTIDDVRSFVGARAGEEVNLLVRALGADDPTALSLRPTTTTDGAGFLGIGMEMVGTLQLDPLRALWYGLLLTGEVTVATVKALVFLLLNLVTGETSALANITGPVGLAGIVGTTASLGFSYLLNLVAIISINLAVINLFPFPALDGGRLLFLAIEGIIRRPLKSSFLNWANTAGFILLLLAMVLVTYRDIARLVAG